MLKQTVRRIVLPGMLAVLVVALSGCPLVGGGAVFIRDAALDSAIRAELGKPLGILSQADLLNVTELDASGLNIATLDGIEGCRNLTVLDLRNNNVRVISSLENLVNLRVLDLGNNNVAQITAISGLFLLEEVTLSGPNMDIVDWSPLSANATNGGLGVGDVVVLPTNTTLDTEGNVLAYWENDYLTLIDLGVEVLFDSMGTTDNTSGT